MATEKQRELFHKLFSDKTFPDAPSQAELEAKFLDLSDKEASRWIEKALELPDKDDSGEPVPF